mmetsp:Transcript_22960/g.50031  ORF Transcript_22960/g.50031 Transcript_22960/m.50031 type:complete len:155 (-) Transcript_22960:1289-1753(-)
MPVPSFYAIVPAGFFFSRFKLSISTAPCPTRFAMICFSASSMPLSPVISAKYNDMSSKLRPFVSGIKKKTKTNMTTQTAASIRKNGVHPMAFAVDRKVDDISVATILLKNVATDIPFARMLVGKISDGISQAAGPIPMLKNERYRPSPINANVD